MREGMIELLFKLSPFDIYLQLGDITDMEILQQVFVTDIQSFFLGC
jgi:hypothetical protein